jgi:hypothetical protein
MMLKCLFGAEDVQVLQVRRNHLDAQEVAEEQHRMELLMLYEMDDVAEPDDLMRMGMCLVGAALKKSKLNILQNSIYSTKLGKFTNLSGLRGRVN